MDAAPHTEPVFSESVKKTLARREITEDQVRLALSRAYYTERTPPNGFVCVGEIDDGRALRIQCATLDGKNTVLHASFLPPGYGG